MARYDPDLFKPNSTEQLANATKNAIDKIGGFDTFKKKIDDALTESSEKKASTPKLY